MNEQPCILGEPWHEDFSASFVRSDLMFWIAGGRLGRLSVISVSGLYSVELKLNASFQYHLLRTARHWSSC